ncbi:MAG: hypothetical protein ACTSXX_07505 [Candidatus Baldrarchaeia archaeon]
MTKMESMIRRSKRLMIASILVILMASWLLVYMATTGSWDLLICFSMLVMVAALLLVSGLVYLFRYIEKEVRE